MRRRRFVGRSVETHFRIGFQHPANCRAHRALVRPDLVAAIGREETVGFVDFAQQIASVREISESVAGQRLFFRNIFFQLGLSPRPMTTMGLSPEGLSVAASVSTAIENT